MSVIVYDHPLSPYAQKVKIALDEKGVAYQAKLPAAIGSGNVPDDFAAANPRGEVPALLDGDVAVFDSTIILAYVEERWPDPPLLPASPEERARVRMLEEVLDTHYEAITWGLGEIRAFGRASGGQARAMEARAREQLDAWHRWLDKQLDGADWFNGARFGHGDLCAAPFVNGAAGWGFGPKTGTALAAWLERVNRRPSVAKAAQAALAVSQASSGANLDAVRQAVEQGLFKREYRDHRLEWMVKSGGLDVVVKGLERENIRFTEPFEA